jgi:hypothetical protein
MQNTEMMMVKLMMKTMVVMMVMMMKMIVAMMMVVVVMNENASDARNETMNDLICVMMMMNPICEMESLTYVMTNSQREMITIVKMKKHFDFGTYS